MTQWVKVISLAEFPETVHLFVYESTRIAIFRKGDIFYAIDDECSHAVASLAEGEVCDHEITCPKHGARFDLRTGKNLSFPAVTPVKSYPVKIEGEDLLIDVEES